MDQSMIVLRVHIAHASDCDSKQQVHSAIDWTVQGSVSFQQTLEVISKMLETGTVLNAFEYEDEEGDRITVRSDNEMSNMIKMHLDQMKEIGETHPLDLYPRASKAPGMRNKLGLKVETGKKQSTSLIPLLPSPMEFDFSTSKRKVVGDINKILESSSLLTDKVIERGNLLGNGQIGTVYEALHKPSGTKMAVKVISLNVEKEVKDQIMMELQVLHKCESTYIIVFYGAFFVDDQISICTEYMDGGSLDRFGRIEEDILCQMCVSIVKGLHYMWSLKIMHRDVKPSNILINTLGAVKLCDFGVSVELVKSITKTYVGTNAYMAPERISGEGYTVTSDVWSLGISLFEMAMGENPFEDAGNIPGKLCYLIVNHETPVLSSDLFSASFVDFTSLCLRKNFENRPSLDRLLRHNLITKYSILDLNILAEWVKFRIN